jgi:hypothetical protein
MVRFRIEAGIGRNAAHPHPRERFCHKWPELINIRPGSATVIRGKNKMRVDVTHEAQLGKAVINHGFPGATHVSTATNKVAAGGRGFQSGRIDRGPRHTPLTSQVFADRGVQQMFRWNAGTLASNRRADFCSVV